MAKKKRGGHEGGHGWFVTFADLMALLVAFFVMLVAFSTQDAAKLQVVAGSMRDAFGVQDKVRYSGVIEVMGLPTRPKLKNVANIDPKDASATPAPDDNDRNRSYGARFKEDRKFALASASLRQALQNMPEISEASKHIMLEETKQGLNIAHATDDSEAGAVAQGDAVPHFHFRSHRDQQGSAQARIWSVGIVGRPRQCGAPDSCRRGRTGWQFLHGCRQGRQRAVVSG